MRRSNRVIALSFLLLLAALPGAKAHAQGEESGGRVQFRDGRISFVPPAGFKPMSKRGHRYQIRAQRRGLHTGTRLQ
jgi:hypothetical protein